VFLTAGEVAKRLGIDESTLQQFALTWVAAQPENELASRLAEARRRAHSRGPCLAGTSASSGPRR
jgi:hypothetical protein